MLGMERFSVSAPGRFVNEYRIHGGSLELRTWDPEANSTQRGAWKRLETNEIMLHLMLDTVVGRWLMSRRGFQKALESQGLPAGSERRKQAT
jgi:hypothetical protein